MRQKTTSLRRLAQHSATRLAASVPPSLHPRIRALAVSASPSGRWAGRALAGLMRHGGVPPDDVTFRLTDRRELQFARSDSLIMARVYWAGESGWEPELVPWWRFACVGARRAVEIGANVGYFTVQGASAAPDTRYRAVEPHPASAEALRRNVGLNGLANVEVIEGAAVTDAAVDAVTLNIPELDHYAAPAGAFVGGEVRAHLVVGSVLEVPAVPITTLVAGADLIKLDVEGQEASLLGAVMDDLATDTPTIFVEVLDEADELREVLRQLTAQGGYSLYLPVGGHLVALPAAALATTRLQRAGQGRDLILSTDPAFEAVARRY